MFFPLERDPKVLAADISTLTADGGGDIPAAIVPRLYKHVKILSDRTEIETLYFRMPTSDLPNSMSSNCRHLAVSPYYTSIRLPLPPSDVSRVSYVSFAHICYLSELWADIYKTGGGAGTAELYDPVLESALRLSLADTSDPTQVFEYMKRVDDTCALLESAYCPVTMATKPISWGDYISLNTFLLELARTHKRDGEYVVVGAQKTYVARLAAARPCEAVAGEQPIPLRIPDDIPVLYSPMEIVGHINSIRMGGSPDGATDYVTRFAFINGVAHPVFEQAIDRYRRYDRFSSVRMSSEETIPREAIHQHFGSPRIITTPVGIYRACQTVYDLATKHSEVVSKLSIDSVYIDVVQTFGEEMMFIVSARSSPNTPLFVIHIDFARLLLWPTNLQRIVRPERKLPEPMF